MTSSFLGLFRRKNRSRRNGEDCGSFLKRKKRYVVRMAVYDSPTATPRIIDINSADISKLLDEISNKTYSFSHEKGGKLPYIVIKEIVENLIHADFQDAIITILPDGNTIRVSDQGPGVPDKRKAFLPGFTTAKEEMRPYIRGVGSGLPIVRESLKSIGGEVVIEDNLRQGSVVTLSFTEIPESSFSSFSTSKRDITEISESLSKDFTELENLNNLLSSRQKKVFLLLADLGEAGPSNIVKELNISLSTAYRDLVALEEQGLIAPVDNTGKRKLTEKGIRYLSSIFQ